MFAVRSVAMRITDSTLYSLLIKLTGIARRKTAAISVIIVNLDKDYRRRLRQLSSLP